MVPGRNENDACAVYGTVYELKVVATLMSVWKWLEFALSLIRIDDSSQHVTSKLLIPCRR